MHPASVRTEVLRLAGEGVNDCEIARRLDLPRTTVRDMRRFAGRQTAFPFDCARCWRRTRPTVLEAADYALLLGYYLGDGCVSRLGRSYSLRIVLDAAYPGIIDEVDSLLRRCLPASAVNCLAVTGEATVVVVAYSSHWPCIIPQAAPGKKHARRIVLESWQQAAVDAAPFAFLRGLIYSDGSVFPNRTGKYTYWSYHFANLSADILDLFCATCDAVGVEYRRYEHAVRINRRGSVALLDQHVGVKA